MERPGNCENAFYEYMTSCWKKIPENRPNFEALEWILEDYFEDR